METNKRGVTVFLYLSSFLFAILPALEVNTAGTTFVAGVFFGVICAVMGPAFYLTQPLISFCLSFLFSGDPVRAFFAVLPYVAIGIVCGVCFRKRKSFRVSAFAGTIALTGVSLLAMGVAVYMGAHVLNGKAIADFIADNFTAFGNQYQAMLALQKIPTAQIGQIMVTARNLYLQMFPAIVILTAMIQAALTVGLCAFLCNWFTELRCPMSKVQLFQVSAVGGVFFALVLGALLFTSGVWTDAALNIAVICGAPLLLQGFLSISPLRRKIPPRYGFFFYMGIFWLIIFVNPAVIAGALALLGVADCFANFRKLP